MKIDIINCVILALPYSYTAATHYIDSVKGAFVKLQFQREQV